MTSVAESFVHRLQFKQKRDCPPSDRLTSCDTDLQRWHRPVLQFDQSEHCQDQKCCTCSGPLRAERFIGTLRNEVLNTEWFSTTDQAQIVINQWLRQYNHVRPHQTLGMRPPVPETIYRNV